MQSFRYDFFPIWRLQTTVCTALVFAVWLGLSYFLNRPLNKPDALLSLTISAICALVLGMVTLVSRFQVSAEGLRTFNSMGQWRWLPWEAIAKVEPARFYFLPHLRLTADGQARRFWLPLFLHDIQGFRAAVLEHAGAEHPLSRSLPLPARLANR